MRAINTIPDYINRYNCLRQKLVSRLRRTKIIVHCETSNKSYILPFDNGMRLNWRTVRFNIDVFIGHLVQTKHEKLNDDNNNTKT